MWTVIKTQLQTHNVVWLISILRIDNVSIKKHVLYLKNEHIYTGNNGTNNSSKGWILTFRAKILEK